MITNTLINYNEAHVMCEVDRLVQLILKSKELKDADALALFNLVPSFDFHYKECNDNTTTLRIMHEYLQPLKASESIEKSKSFLKELRQIHANTLLESMTQKKRVESNRLSLKNYLNKLTQHYSRLLCIRIDLYFSKKAQVEIAFNEFYQYFMIFRNRLANKDGCFQNLQGYVWAIEQGIERGYHCHLLLIYDGSKHQNDFGLALKVGQYWSALTEQKGEFFTSNDPRYKAKIMKNGIWGLGMINRNQPEQISRLIQAAMYLVNPEKTDQYLRSKIMGKRLFGTGCFENSKRRGIEHKSKPLNFYCSP